jgi:pimeloyl-ACP methyl ester carboxylesterase
MPKAQSNGIDIEYEEFGQGTPLVLIMGLGAQLVHWPDDFCQQLASRGFRVVRFDNRDSGLSSKIQGRAGNPRLLIARALAGMPIDAIYTLNDMADDVAGLLDALGIDSAHVAGVSMGGMIAQTLAILHPHRVRSLTSIMSTPGGRRYMLAKPRALRALFRPVRPVREHVVENAVHVFRTIAGRRYPPDDTLVRATAGSAFDRGFFPAGFVRHTAAVLASGSRAGALRFVRVPSLVLHGSDDPLIFPSAARATARAIPGARLHIIDGWGHNLPRAIWPTVIEEIVQIAQRGDQRASTRSART